MLYKKMCESMTNLNYYSYIYFIVHIIKLLPKVCRYQFVFCLYFLDFNKSIISFHLVSSFSVSFTELLHD